jgi:F-type H+-transporting ATPase subunit epsilon
VTAFALHLQGATQAERVDDVVSFVGTDASGSFGILPGHARFMTVLEYGLSRYRRANDEWSYVASPGGVLYFVDDALYLYSRRHVVDMDFGRISALLAGQLAQEEASLTRVKDNLNQLERELFRRLRQLGQNEP